MVDRVNKEQEPQAELGPPHGQKFVADLFTQQVVDLLLIAWSGIDQLGDVLTEATTQATRQSGIERLRAYVLARIVSPISSITDQPVIGAEGVVVGFFQTAYQRHRTTIIKKADQLKTLVRERHSVVVSMSAGLNFYEGVPAEPLERIANIVQMFHSSMERVISEDPRIPEVLKHLPILLAYESILNDDAAKDEVFLEDVRRSYNYYVEGYSSRSPFIAEMFPTITHSSLGEIGDIVASGPDAARTGASLEPDTATADFPLLVDEDQLTPQELAAIRVFDEEIQEAANNPVDLDVLMEQIRQERLQRRDHRRG